jgi:hypothetical protein
MDAREQRAREIVGWYTLVAAGTGGVPIPASSAAVIANNGFMIAHVSTVMGTPVTWERVAASVGFVGTLNVMGKTVFVEAAKTLAWGTGSLWALAALSAAGAATAGLQTYVIGLISIEMAKQGGDPLSSAASADLFERAKQTYAGFVAEMTAKKVENPGTPSGVRVHDDPPPTP